MFVCVSSANTYYFIISGTLHSLQSAVTLMRQYTTPPNLQGTLKHTSLGKLSIASCALVLALGQTPCFAQAAGDAPAPQAAMAQQQGTPDVAKELDAMKKRIEQLEAELNKEKQEKDKEKAQAPAVAV